MPPSPCSPGPLVSDVLGLGQLDTCAANSIAFRLKSEFPAALFPFAATAPAIGVGHDEQPFPLVTGTDFGRAEYSCRNAVAQPFQCRDQCGELSVRVPRHVFAEETTRPALGNDAYNLVDEEPVVICPAALSGNAVWLARVAATDAIHEAAPRSSVEGSKVRPDSRLSQVARFHARGQCCGGISFPLHESDAARSGHGDLDSKVKSSDPGAQGKQVVGR